MRTRQLGNSDLQIPVIIFGAWVTGGWYWGGADDSDSLRAIRASVDHGAICIDTAPIYGFGHSEEVVAKALHGVSRDKYQIATKACLRWDIEEGDFFFETEDQNSKPRKVYRNLKAHSIKEECERSLKRLKTDYIDLYQCHWPDVTTDPQETMQAMEDLKREGKIRWYGVSNFMPDLMETCLQHGEIVSTQPQYSLLIREREQDVLPFCREHGLGVIVYSPLEQGMLTGKVTMDREFGEKDFRNNRLWFRPENRERAIKAVDQMRPIADEHNCTLAQLTLAWTIAEPGITSAIVGARNEEQVKDNCGAAEVNLSDEERAQIRKIFEDLGDPIGESDF